MKKPTEGTNFVINLGGRKVEAFQGFAAQGFAS